MRVVCCQIDIAWEEKAANFRKVRQLLENARLEPGSLVLLPEMFATGFSMNVTGIAEPEEGPTTRFLAETARAHGIYLLGGLVQRAPDGRGRNEAALFSPEGQQVTRYRKLHRFRFGGEQEQYEPGEEIVTAAWGDAVIAPFICYDLRFPEVFRAAIDRGVHLFAVIANWPTAREEHWVTLLRARAIENQAYVVGVNRCGHDPKLAYPGRSLIVDPRGEVLADAGRDEGLISATLDLKALANYRRVFPALADRRGCGS